MTLSAQAQSAVDVVAQLDSETQTLAAELDETRTQIITLQNDLAEAQSENEELKKKLEALMVPR